MVSSHSNKIDQQINAESLGHKTETTESQNVASAGEFETLGLLSQYEGKRTN